jgi:hypothetical protein
MGARKKSTWEPQVYMDPIELTMTVSVDWI